MGNAVQFVHYNGERGGFFDISMENVMKLFCLGGFFNGERGAVFVFQWGTWRSFFLIFQWGMWCICSFEIGNLVQFLWIFQ